MAFSSSKDASMRCITCATQPLQSIVVDGLHLQVMKLNSYFTTLEWKVIYKCLLSHQYKFDAGIKSHVTELYSFTAIFLSRIFKFAIHC